MDENRSTEPRFATSAAFGVGDAARVQVQSEAVHQRVEFLHYEFRIAEINGQRTQFRAHVRRCLVRNEEYGVRFEMRVLFEILRPPPLPPPALLPILFIAIKSTGVKISLSRSAISFNFCESKIPITVYSTPLYVIFALPMSAGSTRRTLAMASGRIIT